MKNSHWKTVVFLGLTTLLLAVLTFGGAGVTYALPRTEVGIQPLQLAAQADPKLGLVVVEVDADGPAAAAGLVRGDILQGLNDNTINSVADLQNALEGLEAGDDVTLTILHGDDVRTLTAELAERNGQVYLGLTPYVARTGPFGPLGMLQNKEIVADGARIIEVIEESPAAQAALVAGDVIVSVDGEAVGPDTGLAELISAYKPGDSVELEIRREGEENRLVTVVLAEHPDRKDAAYLGVRYAPALTEDVFKFDGLPFEGLPFEFDGKNLPFDMEGTPFGEIPESIVEQGAVIVTVLPGGPAEKAGLEKGTIITAIDGEEMSSPEAIIELLAEKTPGDIVTLTLKQQGDEETEDVKVTLGEHPQKEGAGYLGVEIGVYMRMENRQGDEVPMPDWLPFHMPQGDHQFEFRRDFNLEDLPFDLDQLPFDLNELKKNFDFKFELPPQYDNNSGQSL